MGKKPVKITIEFEDGSVEIHDTSDGGSYKTFNTHREDTNIKGRIVEFWEGHIVTWNEGRITREEQQAKAKQTANQS